MKKIVALLLLTAAVAWGQPAFQEDDSLPPPGDRPRMMERLKLTAEQEQKIDRLRVDLEKKQIATRAQMQTLRIDLRELFKADKPDRSAIEGTMKEIQRLEGDLRLARVGHWFDVSALLTPEQQKIWKEHRMMDGQRMQRGRMEMRRHMFRRQPDDDEEHPEPRED